MGLHMLPSSGSAQTFPLERDGKTRREVPPIVKKA